MTPPQAEWKRLYGLAAWQRIRRLQLNTQPLCEPCLAAGRTSVATVVHHKIAHKGDIDLFLHGPFESHCDACHNTLGDEEDRKGFHSQLDADGFPTDARHPFNRIERG